MVYLSVILSIVAVAVAIYYYYGKRNFFEKHGVLHVPPRPIVGNMAPMVFRTSSFVEMLQKSYDLHPDAKYVGFYEFSTPVIILRDLDLIKSVCIKNFEAFHDHRMFFDRESDKLLGQMLFSLNGEKWKENRNMLSPTFTSNKIKSMFALMSNCAIQFANFFSQLPEKERVVELKNVLTKYTNDVIASCVFGIAVDSLNDPNNLIYVNGKKSTNFAGLAQSIKMLLIRNMHWLAKLLDLHFVSPKIESFFEDIIKNTIETRDRKNIYRPDMLQLLMETRNKKKFGKGLSVEAITSHAFGFFFGGFDTVASQACLAIHHLAVNPEIQKKLQNEIDRVFEKSQGQVTYDDINGMEYLDAIINEMMRMTPIAITMDRLCVKDFELPPALPGGKPLTVKAGVNIWIPVYSIQHDPNYFDNPEKFDPDRFLNDGKRIMSSGAYFPFGIGPRMCIGNRFALIEIKVLLCHLLARCDLKPCSKTCHPLEFAKGVMAVTAKNGFWVNIEPRSNPPPIVHAPMTNGTAQTREE